MHLFLLPGLLCDAALWAPQVDALSDVAQVTVADFTTQDSMTEMAQSVLSAAPDRFALAGLSMGGYVAHEIMRLAPERVERLALLDTSAREDTDEQRSRRRGLIELANKGQFKGITPRLLPLFLHEDRLDDAPLVDIVIGMAGRVGKDAFLRQQAAILGRPDSRQQMTSYACPTLVLCGRQDALTPLVLSEEMAEAIPEATLVVIEECGHLPTLERPEQATAAIRAWLSS